MNTKNSKYSDIALMDMEKYIATKHGYAMQALAKSMVEGDPIDQTKRYKDIAKICNLFLDFIHNEMNKDDENEDDENVEYTENYKIIGDKVMAETTQGDWLEIGKVVAREKPKNETIKK